MYSNEQDIINKGSVMVYGSADGQNWTILPRAVTTTTWGASFKINSVEIWLYSTSATIPDSYKFSQAKVVVIAGN